MPSTCLNPLGVHPDGQVGGLVDTMSGPPGDDLRGHHVGDVADQRWADLRTVDLARCVWISRVVILRAYRDNTISLTWPTGAALPHDLRFEHEIAAQ